MLGLPSTWCSYCLLIFYCNTMVVLCSGQNSTITSPTLDGTNNTIDGGDHIERHGFLTGFLSSLQVTILSELGDNSFFISLVLAMKHSRALVFFGAMSAFFFTIIFTGTNNTIRKTIGMVILKFFQKQPYHCNDLLQFLQLWLVWPPPSSPESTRTTSQSPSLYYLG